MRQVLQHLRTGQIECADLPAPLARPGALLIRTSRSLISAGTERSLVEFARSGWIGKARSQPEKVRQVLDKIKTDGLMPTLETVFARLDEPMPLGYCNAGVVLEVGPGVTGFAPGDRVASNGSHAELVCVPPNLCAKIPDGVSDEEAAFTVLSSIALQGIRLVQPTLGENIVVYGLGLIGLIAVQLLAASGCNVLGIDVHPDRLRLAQKFGARTFDASGGASPVAAGNSWTSGKGVDGVLITASAQTDEIMHAAAQMCRKRGRIVLVGVVGLNLRRPDFYEKELTFQVSCSYGPGRYDERYEQGGQDYPYAYVRWTEQRNLEAVLAAMQAKRLLVHDLITHRYPLAEAPAAYATIRYDSSSLGVILEYPAEVSRAPRINIPARTSAAAGQAVVGIIGAGNFAKLVMGPNVAKAGARLKYVADVNAAAAQYLARKCGGEQAVTDYRLLLEDPEVKAVLIAVGHSLHARFVCEALAAGKHAFVEKPLAMNPAELGQVMRTAAEHPDRLVMVGFNRRFSPHALKMKSLLAGRSEPLCMNMTVNAGYIPPEHWVQDPVRGGERIIGEGCHFIDLLSFLAGSQVRTVAALMAGEGVATRSDKMSIVLGFEDGSVGTVNYFANGSKAYPKEQLEVFSEGRVLRLDNFRRVSGYGFGKFKQLKSVRQDKGHAAEFAAFVQRVTTGGPALIPLDELVNVTLATFAAMTAARERRTIDLAAEYGEALGVCLRPASAITTA
ncbi:MAG: bi-domain-containing oxidoreductase [Phycisphaerae bacterium]|jgi:predicted dehydrogenase/threonine dehydrogenase-like Zn-dependent dehydrogenase|nr:bi-domain-containing oxidoreductase [Phycisphaerae bacterium]